MAHFVEIESQVDPTGFTTDIKLVVKRVVTVGDDIPAGGGTLGDNDMHIDGETWCVNFFGGGTWKQTSYTGKFRQRFAQVGGQYDAAKDVFIDKRFYRSYSLDSENEWMSPTPYPSSVTYGDPSLDPQPTYTTYWDEPNLRYLGYDDNENEFLWDHDSKSWSSTGRVFNDSPFSGNPGQSG